VRLKLAAILQIGRELQIHSLAIVWYYPAYRRVAASRHCRGSGRQQRKRSSQAIDKYGRPSYAVDVAVGCWLERYAEGGDGGPIEAYVLPMGGSRARRPLCDSSSLLLMCKERHVCEHGKPSERPLHWSLPE